MTYIDPRGKALAHLDRIVGWQRAAAGKQPWHPAPVTVEWDLSNRCVLGCQDCHFAHTHVKGPWATKPRLLPMAYDSTGDLADLRLVGTALDQLSRAGVQGIVWSGGGEPTTHPDWQQIVTLAHAMGFQQGMYTLGGLLTKPSAKVLATHATWVVVSLDAADAETYAAEKGVPPERFTVACDGARWLADVGCATVGVSFLLHEGNWFRAPEMLALARSLGATYTTFRPAIRTSPDRPAVTTDDRSWIDAAYYGVLLGLNNQADVEVDAARFLAYRHWTGHGYDACLGIRLNTTITPDGRVWLCPQRRGVGGSCLGDLRTESFQELWARHPGSFAVDAGCRVMCRLHPVNETLAALEAPRTHGAFV